MVQLQDLLAELLPIMMLQLILAMARMGWTTFYYSEHAQTAILAKKISYKWLFSQPHNQTNPSNLLRCPTSCARRWAVPAHLPPPNACNKHCQATNQLRRHTLTSEGK